MVKLHINYDEQPMNSIAGVDGYMAVAAELAADLECRGRKNIRVIDLGNGADVEYDG